MSLSIDEVKQILKRITDPLTGRDLITAGRVEDIQLDGDDISLAIVLPNLNAPNKGDLHAAVVGAIQDKDAHTNVHVHFKAVDPEASKTNTPIPQIKNIIAVASGKGGVGKSTVSTNLAFALKELGYEVGLMDADVYGPSIPTMLGLQGQRPQIQDVYGSPKMVPLEAYGLPVISIGNLIDAEQAVVLRGPRLAGVIRQFISDVVWPNLDFLIVDLPPGTGDVQLTLVQTVPVTGAVLVTTPQEVAVVDAVKAMNMFRLPQINVPILGVVENMAWFTPEELPDNKYFIFGQGGGKKLTQACNSMLLGQIPIVQGIREAGDFGKPVILHKEPHTYQAFIGIAQSLLKQLAIRHELLEPTKVVQVQI
jgi:ATP-binding protein involved in chromosome partitioning